MLGDKDVERIFFRGRKKRGEERARREEEEDEEKEKKREKTKSEALYNMCISFILLVWF